MPEYTEGIAGDGAAILKDGVPMSVSEVIAELNRANALEEALTPSAETKFVYMGEFEFPVLYEDENGDEVTYEEAVPWVTIKEIMKAIRERAEATC